MAALGGRHGAADETRDEGTTNDDGCDGGEERRIMNETGEGVFFFFLDSAARGSGS